MKFSKWVFQAILISLLAAGCISPTSQQTEESTPLSTVETPGAASSSTHLPENNLTETPRTGWAVYTDTRLDLVFQLPAAWQRVERNGALHQFEGPNGYASFSDSLSPMFSADTVEEICQKEIGLANKKYQVLGQKPYGSQPEVISLQVDHQPACLTLPSADQDENFAKTIGSFLIAKYPADLEVEPGVPRFLTIEADKDHIQSIAETVHFTTKETSQPVEQLPNAAPSGLQSSSDTTLAQTPSLVPTRTAQLAQRSIQALTPTPTEVALPTLRDTPLQLPSGLTVEEYALEDRPSFEPLSFSPIQGSQAGVRARRELERRKSFPDNSFFDHMHFSGRASLDGAELVAYEDYNQGGSDGWVIVERNGEQIYQVSTGPGSPLTSLQGLWVYDDHWILETAFITSRLEGNMVYTDATGRISQDGKLLNDLYDYEEMFGFQLMAGRPFYFFKQDGKIGFSYDGQVVEAGYDEIPHYSCCSAAGLNPVRAQNMVAFFAQRDSIWYYVEIGVYE
jgi:hypothetical protein